MENIATIEQRALTRNYQNGIEEAYVDFFALVEGSDLNMYIQTFNYTQIEHLQHIILTRIKHLLMAKRTIMTSDFVQNFCNNFFVTVFKKSTSVIYRVYVELMAKMFVVFCKDFTLTGNQINTVKGLINPDNMIKDDYELDNLVFVINYNADIVAFLQTLGKEKQKESPTRTLKEVFFSQFLTNVLEQEIIVMEFLIYKLNKNGIADNNMLSMFNTALETYIYILTSQVDIQTKDDINTDDIFDINESCTAFTIPIKNFRNNDFWGKIIKPNFIESLMNLIHRPELLALDKYPDFIIAILKIYIIAASANLNYFHTSSDRDHFIASILKYLSMTITSNTVIERIENTQSCINIYQLMGLSMLKCFLFDAFAKIAHYTNNYTELVNILTINYLRVSKAKIGSMDESDLKNLIYYLTHIQNIERNFEKRLLDENIKDFFLVIVMRLLNKIKEDLKERNDFNSLYESSELLISAISYNLSTIAAPDITGMVAELVAVNDIQQISLFIMLIGKVTHNILNVDNFQLSSSQFFIQAVRKFLEILNMLFTCNEIKSNDEGFIFYVAHKTMFELFKKIYKSIGINIPLFLNELQLNTDESNDLALIYLRLVNHTITLAFHNHKDLVRLALQNFNAVVRAINMNKYSNTVQLGRLETSAAIITNSQILLNNHFADCNISILGNQLSEVTIFYELITRVYCQYLIMNFEREELIAKFIAYTTSIKNVASVDFKYFCKVIEGVFDGIQGSWFNEILFDHIIVHFISAISSMQIAITNKVLKLMATLTAKRFTEKLTPEKSEVMRLLYPNMITAISSQIRQSINNFDLSKDLNSTNKLFIVPLQRFLTIMGNLFKNFKTSYEDLEHLWNCFDQVFLMKVDLSVVQIYVNELKEIFIFISNYVIRDQTVLTITKKSTNYLNLLYVMYNGMETLQVSSYINTLDFTIKNILHHVTTDDIQFLLSCYVETGLLIKMGKVALNDLFSRNLGQDKLLVNFLYSLWIVDNTIFETLLVEMSWAKKQIEFLNNYVQGLNNNSKLLRLKQDHILTILDIFLNAIN